MSAVPAGNPRQILARRVRDAIVALYGPDFEDADPLIRPSSFADFQSDAAFPLARRLGRPACVVATEIARRIEAA